MKVEALHVERRRMALPLGNDPVLDPDVAAGQQIRPARNDAFSIGSRHRRRSVEIAEIVAPASISLSERSRKHGKGCCVAAGEIDGHDVNRTSSSLSPASRIARCHPNVALRSESKTRSDLVI